MSAQWARYMLLAEHAARGRQIELVDINPALIERRRHAGFQVFAFPDAARQLTRRGDRVEPVRLLDRRIGEVIRTLRDDWIIAMGLTPDALAMLQRDAPGSLGLLGTQVRPSSRPPLLTVVGRRAGAVASQDSMQAGISLPPRASIDGAHGPADALRIEATTERAAVHLGAHELAAVEGGAALAIFASDGRLVASGSARTDDGLRLPFDDDQLYRVTWAGDCVDVGSLGWRNVTRLATAGRLLLRINNYRPYDASAAIVLRTARPAAPRVTTRLGPHKARVAIASGAAAVASARELPPGWTPSPLDSVLQITINGEGRNASVLLDAGTAIAEAWVNGRADRSAPSRMRACTPPPPGHAHPGGHDEQGVIETPRGTRPDEPDGA